MKTQELIQTALTNGARCAAVIDVADIPFNREFRAACESNACGNYGKCWTCPPHIGDIDELIAQAKGYHAALVFQTVGTLEDSYDIEGMTAAAKHHNVVTRKIREQLFPAFGEGFLTLGAGACQYCEICSQQQNLPCRFPDKALTSLECYGIAVSELAGLCNMKYINGQNTVTYFGIVLY